MRKAFFGSGVLLVMVSLGWILLASADQKIQPQTKGLNPQVLQRLDDLPLYFVENKGQAAAEVKFQVKIPQADVLFSDNEIVYQFVRSEQRPTEPGAALPAPRSVLRVGFVGSGQKTGIHGEKVTSARFNYLRGSDPSKWVGEAAAYEKILYRELYPGIDLSVAGNAKRFKNEYLVKAGADPAAIRLKYDGADGLSVNEAGQLEVRLGEEKLIEDAPSCYQIIGGRKLIVEAAYRIGSDGTVGFNVGPYRKDADLVIDPVLFSTFLGGNGYCSSGAIAVDGGGNVYVTGNVYESSFSTTTGAFDTTANGGGDAFVMKLNAAGTGVSYATYLGGGGSDNGLGIAVDGSGNAYVMGVTRSSDFPVTAGAFDATYHGGGDLYGYCGGDCFVTKLNAAGSGLVYSTYLGGSGGEPIYSDYYYGSSRNRGNLIAVDKNGSAYVTGWTKSTDFPTTAGAFDRTFNETGSNLLGDGFLTKLNASGTGLVYSTFLGGSGIDNPLGMALDDAGNVYVTGETVSADFPVTTGAYDIGLDGRDAFLAKINPSGTGLVYATFMGGGYNDWGTAVAVDGSGNAYVTGTTESNNFPMTSGAWDTTYNGLGDAFVAKLNDTGSSLLYATYLGGQAGDSVAGIGLDGSGNAYVAGSTSSSDFPVVPGYLAAVIGGRDVFVTKFNASGTSLAFSTFFGGRYDDSAAGMTLDGGGNIFVTGYGGSGFMATDGAYDTQGSDSFALKMTAVPVLVSLQVNKTSLQFSAIASGGVATRNQPVLITGTGPGSLNWTAVADQNWIKITPAAGAGNGAIQVGVDSADLTTEAPNWGYYSGKIKVSDPSAANSPKWIDVALRIYAAGATSPPFGYFDTPLNGTSGITGAVPVTGWAVDDVEVANVKIYRDPVAGEPSGLVFIGDAVFVEGARPDIENDWRLGYGYPLRSFAGWGYMMLTNFLPNHGNGPYKLYAYAYDKEGNNALLGTKSIFCDNAHAVKPFGTIDTPVQGGAVSGSAYVNYAWALTPLPNMIPKNGSTIDVWVDGQNLGHPTYDQYRKDVADNFPGLLNSGGPVGFFYLDSTKFTNGVHSIQWVVTDNGNNNDGIGSRFFTALNTGTPAPGAVEILSQSGERSEAAINEIMDSSRVPALSDILNLPMMFEPVGVKTGFDLKAAPSVLAPDHYGLFHIQTRELELIRISLDPAQADQVGNETAGTGYGGRNNPPPPPFRKGGEKSESFREGGRDGRDSGFREGGEESRSFRIGGRDAKYSGCMIVGGELRPLPIGSTLDARTGAFSWMPGPGFSGAYDFVFVENDASGPTRSIKVKVTIRPKF